MKEKHSFQWTFTRVDDGGCRNDSRSEITIVGVAEADSDAVRLVVDGRDVDGVQRWTRKFGDPDRIRQKIRQLRNAASNDIYTKKDLF